MSDDICIICQQAFDNEVRPGLSHDKVALPCFESHVFGRPCIVAWFDNGHLWCPLCKKKVSEEFAAGLDNRTYSQRMMDAATRTGIFYLELCEDSHLERWIFNPLHGDNTYNGAFFYGSWPSCSV